jgi:ABC-type taurine transport system ATPase subunit
MLGPKGLLSRARAAILRAMADDPDLSFTDEPLHSVFQKQVLEMLDRADLSEEQKQQILVALQCPCCGAGGISLSIPLKD